MRRILIVLALVLAGMASAIVYPPHDMTYLVYGLGLDQDTLETEVAALESQVGSMYLVAAGFATVTNDTLEITVASADSADMVLCTYLTPDGDGMAEWWRIGCWADSTLTFYTEEADSSDGVIQYLVVR